MSGETVPRRTKGPPVESDLSQVMAHGPAYRAAFGPFVGALLIMFAITKARRGPLGIATAVSVVGGLVYHAFLK